MFHQPEHRVWEWTTLYDQVCSSTGSPQGRVLPPSSFMQTYVVAKGRTDCYWGKLWDKSCESIKGGTGPIVSEETVLLTHIKGFRFVLLSFYLNRFYTSAWCLGLDICLLKIKKVWTKLWRDLIIWQEHSSWSLMHCFRTSSGALWIHLKRHISLWAPASSVKTI